MQPASPCTVCQEFGHKAGKCPDLGPNAPPPSGGGGGGHDHDDDEKALIAHYTQLFVSVVRKHLL